MNVELHVMVGAYTLDALEEREQIAFEAHLAGCPMCAGELAEFQDTAARLANAVAVAPPPQLRAAVLDAAARTTQERPVVQLHQGSRWRQRLPMLVAAAAVLGVLGAVGAYIGEHDRLTDLREADVREAAVIAADDAVLSEIRQGDTSVKVFSSDQMDEAVVVMAGVPPLEQSRDYQMWAVPAKGDPRSLAVVDSDDVATSGSTLVGSLDNAQMLAVTVEPDGGSPLPTRQPVLSVQLG